MEPGVIVSASLSAFAPGTLHEIFDPSATDGRITGSVDWIGSDQGRVSFSAHATRGDTVIMNVPITPFGWVEASDARIGSATHSFGLGLIDRHCGVTVSSEGFGTIGKKKPFGLGNAFIRLLFGYRGEYYAEATQNFTPSTSVGPNCAGGTSGGGGAGGGEVVTIYVTTREAAPYSGTAHWGCVETWRWVVTIGGVFSNEYSTCEAEGWIEDET